MRPEGGARRRVATTAGTVTEVVDLTPRMRRVRLGGAPLAGPRTDVPAQTVKLHVPDPATGRPVARDYTVRRYLPDPATLDIDFVLHGDGPAATWARQARAGQTLEFLGPSGRYRPDATADWHLFAGDETALPAIMAMVETLPAGARASLYLEVADAAEHQPVAGPALVRTHWLHRGAAEPGSTDVLGDAVRSATLPAGRGQLWIAGHTPTVRGIRTHLLDERGIDRRWLYVRGFWDRAGVTAPAPA